MPTFDIVMPSHGRPDLLANSLQAIYDNQRPASFNRLILIENGGKLGAEPLCREFADKLPIHYLYSDTPSLSKARNLGISNSDADYILFFDSDIKPRPGALLAYSQGFEDQGSEFFYGGPLCAEYEHPPAEWLREFLPWSARGHSFGEKERLIDEPLFLGGNFAAPRAALIAASGFEGPCAEGQNGGGVGEETRLQQRLLARGYKGYYLPDASVIHPVPKEGCSIDFIVNRQRRHGFTTGKQAAHNKRYDRLWREAPMYYWRQLVIATLSLPQAFNPLASRANRFRARLDFHNRQAMIEGFRRAYRQKEAA